MEKISLKAFLIIALSVFAKASNADTYESWNIVFCDTCSNLSQFENAAKVSDSGYTAVFNLNTNTIKAYKLLYEPALGGRLATTIATPQEAKDALQRHNELKQILEKYLPTSLSNFKVSQQDSSLKSNAYIPSAIGGPFGGVCGPEADQALATRIPDLIFSSSCAGHDSCYAAGVNSKGLCDELFASNLYTSIHIGTSTFQSFDKYLTRWLLENVADIYINFVKTHEKAYDAYCDVSRNSTKDYCEVGFDRLNSLSASGGGQSSSFSGNAFGVFGFELGYRCVRTIFDLDDGFKVITEQCFIAPVN